MATFRKTRTFLSRLEAYCLTTIQNLVKKSELSGLVSDVKKKTLACFSRKAENTDAAAESLVEKFYFLVVLSN